MAMRFYLESALGAAAAGLVLITLAWNDWIEILFKVDPDAGDGSLEKILCGVLITVALTSMWLARAEWRRMQAAATSGAR